MLIIEQGNEGQSMKKNEKNNLKFRKNIYILFIISILIPLFLISTFFSIYYNKQSMKHNQSQIETILSSTSKSFEMYFKQIEQIAFIPYLDKQIFNTISLMKNDFILNPPSYLNVSPDIDQYAKKMINLLYTSTDEIKSITFFPLNEDNSIGYEINRRSPEIQMIHYPEYHQQSWYKNALNRDTTIYSPLITSEQNNEEIFYASREIKDFDTKKIIGVIRIEIYTDYIYSIIDTLSPTDRSFIAITSEQDELIYSSKPLDLRYLQSIQKQQDQMRLKGDTFSLQYQAIPKSDWKLTYVQSSNDILFLNLSSFLFMLLLAILTIIIGFFIFRKQSLNMVESLSKIIDAIEHLKNGKLDYQCIIERDDEFKTIALALNNMGSELSSHIDKEYKAVINQKNAEYIALASQINPHFLYNTLNGFIALNRMGERELLEKNILQLTQLFRYTCTRDILSDVKSEVEFVIQYLELQKFRLENQFDFQVFMEENTKDIVIPKLLIQPIIENSIIHGIDQTNLPMTISISTFIIDEPDLGPSLKLFIEDDGKGFDIQHISYAEERVGLSNIADRIAYFNNQAIFDITSEINQGTLVTIIIPLTQLERNNLL